MNSTGYCIYLKRRDTRLMGSGGERSHPTNSLQDDRNRNRINSKAERRAPAYSRAPRDCPWIGVHVEVESGCQREDTEAVKEGFVEDEKASKAEDRLD